MTDSPSQPDQPSQPVGPGLQVERTALAWQRTGVSGSLVAGLSLITAARASSQTVLIVAAELAIATAAAAWYAAAHHQRSAGRTNTSPWPRLVATAAIPLLLALSGIVIALS